MDSKDVQVNTLQQQKQIGALVSRDVKWCDRKVSIKPISREEDAEHDKSRSPYRSRGDDNDILTDREHSASSHDARLKLESIWPDRESRNHLAYWASHLMDKQEMERAKGKGYGKGNGKGYCKGKGTSMGKGATDDLDGATAAHNNGATQEHDGAIREHDGATDVPDGATDVHDGAADVRDGATDVHDGAIDEDSDPEIDGDGLEAQLKASKFPPNLFGKMARSILSGGPFDECSLVSVSEMPLEQVTRCIRDPFDDDEMPLEQVLLCLGQPFKYKGNHWRAAPAPASALQSHRSKSSAASDLRRPAGAPCAAGALGAAC